MNIDTGKIEYANSEYELKRLTDDPAMIPIEEPAMTDKQRASLSVSLRDFTSVLGRKRHRAYVKNRAKLRKKRKATRQNRKANRCR